MRAGCEERCNGRQREQDEHPSGVRASVRVEDGRCNEPDCERQHGALALRQREGDRDRHEGRCGRRPRPRRVQREHDGHRRDRSAGVRVAKREEEQPAFETVRGDVQREQNVREAVEDKGNCRSQDAAEHDGCVPFIDELHGCPHDREIEQGALELRDGERGGGGSQCLDADPGDKRGKRKEERNSQTDCPPADDGECAGCQCAHRRGAPRGCVVAAVLEPEQEDDCAGRYERSCRADGAGEGEMPSPARHGNVSVGR